MKITPAYATMQGRRKVYIALFSEIFMKIGKALRIAPAGLFSLGVAYFSGHYNGVAEGREEKANEIAMSLALERYDAQAFAKYAGTSTRQQEILKIAEAASRSLEILDHNGHLNDLSPHVRAEAFPLEGK
jgi:hypothetical protein